MKVLILGGFGLLGTAIYNVLSSLNYQLYRYTKDDLNITSKSSILDAVERIMPDVVIHAAGYTDVEMAEVETLKVFELNCYANHYLVSALNQSASKPKLVYFSTDYIFSGDKTSPYNEDDEASPLNQYGWSKLIGENIVQANYEKTYIVRTSWLFGPGGKCFPVTIKSKLDEGKEINVVSDQVGSPTYTYDLASQISKLLTVPFGIYHIANRGSTSWYDFAKAIARLTNRSEQYIRPIETYAANQSLKRPHYSVLNSSKWENTSGISMRNYESALADFLLPYKRESSYE